MSFAVVILAAGKGSRMKSDLPKVLHKIAGAPMLAHVMRTAQDIDAQEIIVVAGHGSEMVEAAATGLNAAAKIVLQTEQLGTGHAVDQTREALRRFEGDVFVMFGDTPFISVETLEKMKAARRGGTDVVVLGFHAAEPGRYGRLVVNGRGGLDAIVEAKDATPSELKIDFCNSGVMCVKARVLFELLEKVGNDNASGEYYLTDIVSLARKGKYSCGAVACPESETLGVNSRLDLAAAEAVFQENARKTAMTNGVTLSDPETVWFGHDTKIGSDTIVEQNVVFGMGVTVESGAEIRAFSHLEGCHVSKGAVVGPYARLRPGTKLGENTKIGNFVEVKNADFAKGAKANHLTYVGDASVGATTNIGAGTITCNYDGVFKHRTEIGERAFIGSNTMLVAPVTIGDDAMTASGSVITKDVPAEALALGRARQENKEGLAMKMMKRLKDLKAKKKG